MLSARAIELLLPDDPLSHWFKIEYHDDIRSVDELEAKMDKLTDMLQKLLDNQKS